MDLASDRHSGPASMNGSGNRDGAVPRMYRHLLANFRKNLTDGAVASTSVISAAVALTVAAAFGALDGNADVPIGLAGGLALAVLFLLPPR